MTEADQQQSAPDQMESFTPGPVLLLGAPGVGKGTQAQALMAAWGIPQVSTGDIIRQNIQDGTGLGGRFQALVAQGQLVPDDIVNGMVAGRVTMPDCSNGYVLDGFPRTLAQASWLDTFLEGGKLKAAEDRLGTILKQTPLAPQRSAPKLPLIAVSIKVRYDELLRRITGRRTGPVSKRIYNIYTSPPTTAGICDVDGEPLVQRPDDTEEVFRERMRTFDGLTAPVIEHYRRLGRFEEVDGEQDVDTVTSSIVAALWRLRHS